VGHSSILIAFRAVLAGVLGLVVLSAALAQPGGGQQQGGQDWHGQQNWQRGPVYQRKAFDWKQGSKHVDFRNKDRRFFQQQFPNVQSNWFTRPYPYHLDYYKMRWGGSYAPYFGNLYGPPQVVTAPPYYGPYYGDWGPGAGAGGYEGGMPNGYGMNGWNGMPVQSPGLSPGNVIEGPVENGVPNSQPATPANGENLPAPGQ
jgi:hypothetical protein